MVKITNLSLDKDNIHHVSLRCTVTNKESSYRIDTVTEDIAIQVASNLFVQELRQEEVDEFEEQQQEEAFEEAWGIDSEVWETGVIQ